VRALSDAPVGLIEAGGGYGKSVLASEFRRHIGTASAEAPLERDTDEAKQLIGALRRGLRRAGLSDTAAALTGSSPAEVAAALDRAPEPVLLVIEEAQHAIGEAADLLAGLAHALAEGHRLLLVGRRLDQRLTALQGAIGATHLGADALAFDDAELRALLNSALAQPPTDDQVTEVRRLALGWPAASALAAAWMARARGGPLSGAVAGSAPLSGMLDELLAGLGADGQRRVAHLAHLPLLSESVASACAGPGALHLLGDAGLPVRTGRPGWAELADPIREELAARAPLPEEAARAAAAAYADAEELATGLALLSRTGDPEGIAALLAARRWQDLVSLDLAELRAILTTLPRTALAAHPFALVQVARLAEQEVDLELRAELLNEALALLEDGAERREVEAELVATRAIVEPGDEVERDASSILDLAAGGETKARARALTAVARVEAWRGDPAAMLRAERRLVETAALCRLAGEVEWEARTLTGLGYRVAFARGDLEQAVAQMSAALALLPESGSERAAAATFLAEALAYVGRLDDAEAAIGEAAAIGRQLGDHRLQAYAAWTGTTLASLQGDGASTIQRIHTVELHPGDWFEHPTGIEFLADAALALARTGARDAAAEYAERARERADAAGYPEIGWVATGVVEARWGDPVAAEEALSSFASSPQQAPRDAWRTLLFRALAASRRHDPVAGGLAAQAYEAAAELGRRDLPTLHEPDVAEIVAPLAAGAGSRAAASASEDARSYVVTLLGGFGVAANGRPLEPPAGRSSTLVKLLALADQPLAAEEVIEVLWPDGVTESTGRQRLRNLLNRLRASCGELVRRDGETLVLGPSEVDARGFEQDAAAAAASPSEERPGLARTALARYKGDLLPGDRYEAWATAPRERLRRRHLELLDLLAEDAVDRGDVDGAIRLLDQAQAAEPLDEDRYVRAAELLLFQGRRGSARALVERATDVRAELGLDESPRLVRLREATGGR
jgi:DNA-binding SARP family transcriptional activator/ATP/maltotriose-dependent transcriptional regulator MalT